MKRTTIILLGLFVLITAPAYSAITFIANYDRTTDADYGVGGTQETYQQSLITNGDSGHTGAALQVDNVDSPSTELTPLYEYSGNIDTSGTVEMWIQPNWESIADTEARYLFSASTYSAPYDDIYIYATGKTIRARFVNNNVITGEVSSGDVIDTGWKNEWHHVAVTFNSTASEAKIYIDGALKDTGNFLLLSNPATKIAVGWYLYASSYSGTMFDGKIDEVVIYNEVKADFANRNEPKYIPGPDPIFMAHYDVITDADYSESGSIIEQYGPVAQIYAKDVESAGKFQASYHSTKLAWGPYCRYNNSTGNFTPTGTVSFWFQPDWTDNTGVNNCFLTITQYSSNDMLHIYTANNAIYANFWNKDYNVGIDFPDMIGGVSAAAITPTWKDEWHHIAVTYDSDNWTAKLYIDGVVVSSMDMSASHPAYSMLSSTIDDIVVGYYQYGENHTEGKIDELSIYDVVRTDFTDRYVPSMKDTRDDTLPVFVAHFDNGLNADASAGSQAPTQADTVGITSGSMGWAGEAAAIGETSVLLYDGANINMAAGTVEMWVKTDTWTADYYDTNGTNVLFSVMDPDTPTNAMTMSLNRYAGWGAAGYFLALSDYAPPSGNAANVGTWNDGNYPPFVRMYGFANNPIWNTKWHHLAVTWEADNYVSSHTQGTVRIYLEGQLAMETWGNYLANVTSYVDFAVGCNRGSLGSQLKGYIDELRIYDYAKTSFLDRYSVYPLYGVPVPNVTITLVSGNVVLRWEGEAGATYQAYYTDSLNASPVWTALGTQKIGAGTHTVTDSAIAATSKRFYKVMVSN